MRWLFFAALAACSNGSSTVDAGADAAIVNNCTTFSDLTIGGGNISFPTTGGAGDYAPACAHIKVGQTITWSGAFASHPLEPIGGDTPNPITATAVGTDKSFAFPNAGTFGFGCGVHASMRGAVLVTP
jgi:plastocyanin